MAASWISFETLPKGGAVVEVMPFGRHANACYVGVYSAERHEVDAPHFSWGVHHADYWRPARGDGDVEAG